jgi:hypothetical protein
MMAENPPLPVVQAIPHAIIEQWIQITPDRYLDTRLTRTEIDNLFFAINNLITSQNALQDALLSYSQGNLDEANSSFDSSRRGSIESLNALRSFMSAVMASSVQNLKTDHER